MIILHVVRICNVKLAHLGQRVLRVDPAFLERKEHKERKEKLVRRVHKDPQVQWDCRASQDHKEYRE
jgi:hypothetical protein